MKNQGSILPEKTEIVFQEKIAIRLGKVNHVCTHGPAHVTTAATLAGGWHNRDPVFLKITRSVFSGNIADRF